MSLRRRGDSSQFWLIISWTIQPNLSRCIQPPSSRPPPGASGPSPALLQVLFSLRDTNFFARDLGAHITGTLNDNMKQFRQLFLEASRCQAQAL